MTFKKSKKNSLFRNDKLYKTHGWIIINLRNAREEEGGLPYNIMLFYMRRAVNEGCRKSDRATKFMDTPLHLTTIIMFALMIVK